VNLVGVGFPGHGGRAGRDGQASDPNGLDESSPYASFVVTSIFIRANFQVGAEHCSAPTLSKLETVLTFPLLFKERVRVRFSKLKTALLGSPVASATGKVFH
jgi:hypothetical protein